MPNQPGKFLTAEWRHLLMLNFAIEPEILRPYVPRGTELDSWNDTTLVSLVGFRFLYTKLLGVPIPFHRNFDEVNLRFYVRFKAGNEWRRGVVFIKEIVPRWMVSCVARRAYNENYVTHRMRHTIEAPTATTPGQVCYEWKTAGRWNRIAAVINGEPTLAHSGSEEEFITEHYWGYTAQRNGSTAEYEVEHAPWRVWSAEQIEIACGAENLYGPAFAGVLAGKPSSAFVADGSAIVVRKGRRI